MLTEVHIAGILIAPIAVYAFVAIIVTLMLRFVLWSTGILNLFWHRALFEVALYSCVLCLLVLYA